MSLVMKLLIDVPILLRSSKTLLQHPVKSKTYPLANKLNLLACISGKTQQELILKSIHPDQQDQPPEARQKLRDYH